MQGPATYNTFTQIILVSTTDETGLFEYNAPPGPGVLPVAYAVAPGVTHDPFGNTLPVPGGGFVSAASIAYTQIAGGNVILGLIGGLGLPSELFLNDTAHEGDLVITSGLAALGNTPAIIELRDSGHGGASGLPGVVIETSSSGGRITAALLELQGAFAILNAATDTVARLAVDITGKMSWSTGAAAADTDLYRSTDPTSSVPVLKTDNEFNPASLNVPANTGAHLGVDGNGLLYLIGTAPATGIRALAQLNGDAIQRWQIDANGKMSWGDGTHAVDTDLYRDAGGSRLVTDVAFLAIAAIETEADFIVFQPGSTNIAFVVQAIGQPNPQFLIDCNGKHLWGPGGSTATDTDLFRQAAGTLATDSILSLKNAGSAPVAMAGYTEIVGSNANLPFVTGSSGQGWFLSGGAQRDFTQTVVTGTGNNVMGKVWTIDSNDAASGDSYEFDFQVIGKQGSTAQSLTIGWLQNGITNIGSISFPAGFAGANAAFLIRGKLVIDIVTGNSASGTFYWHLSGLASAAGGIQTPAGGGPTTLTTNGINTTVNNTVQFYAGWGSATGAPTMTTIVTGMLKVV